MYWIYCWKNNINGKRYIGQTHEGIEARWKRHRDNALKYYESYYRRSAFYSAIRKYGPENFYLEWQYECQTGEEANALETFFIRQYNSITPNGYNITPGGQNNAYENNKWYLIDAETNEIIMHSNIAYIARYFYISRRKFCKSYHRFGHVVINNKLYRIIRDLKQIDEHWCKTPEQFEACRKQIIRASCSIAGKIGGKIGDRAGKSRGGRVGKSTGGKKGRPRKKCFVIFEGAKECYEFESAEKAAAFTGCSLTGMNKAVRDNRLFKCKNYGGKKARLIVPDRKIL